MQNKLAATFGMPRLFPNPFSPFFPLFRRFAVAYLNAAGQQKKKNPEEREKSATILSHCRLSLAGPQKFLATFWALFLFSWLLVVFPLLILLQTKIPVNCRRAINQRGVIKGKNISGIAARRRRTKICAWLYSNWQKTILNNYDNLKSS